MGEASGAAGGIRPTSEKSRESVPSRSKKLDATVLGGSPLQTGAAVTDGGPSGASGGGSIPGRIEASSRTPSAPPRGRSGPPARYTSPGSKRSLTSAPGSLNSAADARSTENSITGSSGHSSGRGRGGPTRLSTISPPQAVDSLSYSRQGFAEPRGGGRISTSRLTEEATVTVAPAVVPSEPDMLGRARTPFTFT